MPTIAFTVDHVENKDTVPPQKPVGAAKNQEKLDALEEAAKKEFTKPFRGDVSLTFRIYREDPDKRGTAGPGDPDNLLTGLCDGLKCIAFEDDSQIVQFLVEWRKGTPNRYEVVVAELTSK